MIKHASGLVGIRVKHARSLCTVEAWCSVLPPPFSWIVQMISKCSQSRRVSQEMRDKTRWSFLSASAASDNSTSRKGSIVKTMEKVYDRYSMRNEPFRSSETPLPRYSDEKHNHSREDSAEKASLSSKRSVVSQECLKKYVLTCIRNSVKDLLASYHHKFLIRQHNHRNISSLTFYLCNIR